MENMVLDAWNDLSYIEGGTIYILVVYFILW